MRSRSDLPRERRGVQQAEDQESRAEDQMHDVVGPEPAGMRLKKARHDLGGGEAQDSQEQIDRSERQATGRARSRQSAFLRDGRATVWRCATDSGPK